MYNTILYVIYMCVSVSECMRAHVFLHAHLLMTSCITHTHTHTPNHTYKYVLHTYKYVL